MINMDECFHLVMNSTVMSSHIIYVHTYMYYAMSPGILHMTSLHLTQYAPSTESLSCRGNRIHLETEQGHVGGVE